jgi:hypothetical protein
MASPPIRRGKWAFLRKFNGFAFGVKNTPKPMKTNKQAQDNDTGIETLLSLIPQYAVNEEIVTAISADYLKNRYETAIALKSGDTNLSTQEHQRFLDNCRVIKGVTLGIELRNYLLWEIYSTQQYRATSQNFETFATQLIQRSAGQVRKCVQAGRIRMEMILADMDEIRPTGRQIEILSKVQDDHTVRAWKFALEYMRLQNGKGDAMAEEALRDYCKINEIPYGKRSPSGSSKIDMKAISRRSKSGKGKKGASRVPLVDGIDWELSPRDEEQLLGIDPDGDHFKDSPEREKRVASWLTAVVDVASASHLSTYQTSQMQAFLAMIGRKDEQLARSLLSYALNHLRDLLAQKVGEAADSFSAAHETAVGETPLE